MHPVDAAVWWRVVASAGAVFGSLQLPLYLDFPLAIRPLWTAK
jgi:hypothetical protein